MFAARQRLVLLIIAGLCLESFGAPVEEQQEGTNPELTDGYFQGGMDVEFQRPNDTDEASSDVEQQEETNPELTAGYFQGDMDVEFQRNGLIAPTRYWPNATVYYKIDEAFNYKQINHIKLAMDRIAYVSCIQFVPATPKTLNYVLITGSKKGCSSSVGYRGGKQRIKLHPDFVQTGCFILGDIEHYLLHTLGFHHQQSSSDRDKYVKINTKNIMRGYGEYFVKYGANEVDNFGVEYDYGSVMHFSSMACSKNGKPTIVALQPEGQLEMGQRYAMSKGDIKRLHKMYKCPQKIFEID